MRECRLTDNQRYTLLMFDSVWRAHKSAFTIAQLRARGYTINNLTLSSLRKVGFIDYSDGQGWFITRAGRHVAELLQELLLVYSNGNAAKAVKQRD